MGGCVFSRLVGWLALLAVVLAVAAQAGPEKWRREWSRTDFSCHTLAYDETPAGGPPKDGIPAINRPSFVPAIDARDLASREPVFSVAIGGKARAYPLRVMIWHEIVNDLVGKTPIAVTWCPLCNSSVVFDRPVDGRTLSFGTTGKLRNSDGGEIAQALMIALVIVAVDEGRELGLEITG